MPSFYERLADLPLTVETSDRTTHEAETTSEFTRTTTVFELAGEGVVGRGEDVTYDTEDHDALASAPPFDFAGEYTFAEFSSALDDVDLFPTKEPERETAFHYRRWAVESAALDLALGQADTDLAAALDRDRRPVRFVVSTRLTEDDAGVPSRARVESLLAAHPGMELKLDPTPAWDDGTVEALAATGAVRILDLKGQYHGTSVGQEPDPDLYRRVVAGFPNAVVEDPALTDETEAVLAEARDRISWDAPITGLESVESLPFEPSWLNVKPSRFGTVESLLDTIEYALERDIDLYGGGQFELDVGREHVQTLASVFYPEGPNDVAPRAYNHPDADLGSLPASPLVPTPGACGLSF